MDATPGAAHLGIRDLRADLASHVRRAAGGERVIVTVDGAPAAQLAPIAPTGAPTLDDLAAAGLVRLPLRPDHPGPPTDLPLLPIDVRADQILSDLRGDPPRRRAGGIG
ncbi:MAG: type II toxin-antitoxin system prevent-host-death family antitoxin [Actinomycetota bacterium]